MRRRKDPHSGKDAVLAAIPPFIFVAILWAIHFLQKAQEWDLHPYGIRPGEWEGLIGIITTVFIHGDFNHLINNSAPLLVLGWAIFYFYRPIALQTILSIQLISGLWIWIAARPHSHIGASGLVYGMAAFVFFSGLIRRERKLVALSLLVAFLYGSMFWGIFPIRQGVSWESHFWGGLAGLLLALYYRKEGPQRPLYDWEREEMEAERERERQAERARRLKEARVVYHYREKKDDDEEKKE